MNKYIVIIIVFISQLICNNSIEIKSLNDIKEGSFLVRSEDGARYKLIPTIDTSINIDIKGMVAHATVNQMFTNNNSEPIEAVYVFPLPSN